jgi:hypothetical protein
MIVTLRLMMLALQWSIATCIVCTGYHLHEQSNVGMPDFMSKYLWIYLS